MAGSPSARAEALRRLVADSPALALLRADLLPVSAAVLGTILDEPPVTMDTSEFLERAEDALDQIRDLGVDAPQGGQEYLIGWIHQGLVVRSPGPGRTETVRLSPAALDAMDFLRRLEHPQSTVTSSRLATVTGLLRSLARDTDPSRRTRLADLHARRDAIDAEIAAVEAGRISVLDDVTAAERLAEVLRLAGQIPADFTKISADLERLNHDLRTQIVSGSGSRGDVLDDVFAGVDVIESSEAGRTFTAFHQLLTDVQRSEALDESVDQILDRPWSHTVLHRDREFLRGLLGVLQDDSQEVRQVMTGFSRSLHRFVETHEYREHRRLAAELTTTRSRLSTVAAEHRATAPTGYELPATSLPISTIASWKLHNPDDNRTMTPVVEIAPGELDLEALREQVRASEIDFDALRRAISLTAADKPVFSLAEVLERFPADQGLASIVGLLVLAEGLVRGPGRCTRSTAVENLGWQTSRGGRRSMSLPRYIISEIPKEWSRRAPIA
ncbi:DUF3375 domain-containing protein [Acidipropionibacterium virtanenii]|uniref:DUF3375 domain-containing protein n=1 Tax=Acidipropionibacterium virtanenii TaxID=2057246 RepID=A0A344UR40_9ACTN|nr:DUF3375 domain-containing protein [Acidipropionibacterium virtanenii]AXE37738.1 hypothetical protein JS278_00545 [Acidipropionibacterium virtanenii]